MRERRPSGRRNETSLGTHGSIYILYSIGSIKRRDVIFCGIERNRKQSSISTAAAAAATAADVTIANRKHKQIPTTWMFVSIC